MVILFSEIESRMSRKGRLSLLMVWVNCNAGWKLLVYSLNLSRSAMGREVAPTTSSMYLLMRQEKDRRMIQLSDALDGQ